MTDIVRARERYAALVREQAGVRSPAIARAFAEVPRESFLGPGPWQVWNGEKWHYERTPDGDPIHVYRDSPIGIEPARMLNNGQPSFVAKLIDALNPREGDRVVHVGCGTGYYTAIIAQAVAPMGRILAIEIDEELADRARRNLAHLAHVEVICSDGSGSQPGQRAGTHGRGGLGPSAASRTARGRSVVLAPRRGLLPLRLGTDRAVGAFAIDWIT